MKNYKVKNNLKEKNIEKLLKKKLLLKNYKKDVKNDKKDQLKYEVKIILMKILLVFYQFNNLPLFREIKYNTGEQTNFNVLSESFCNVPCKFIFFINNL